jgi:hypothetical protein
MKKFLALSIFLVFQTINVYCLDLFQRVYDAAAVDFMSKVDMGDPNILTFLRAYLGTHQSNLEKLNKGTLNKEDAYKESTGFTTSRIETIEDLRKPELFIPMSFSNQSRKLIACRYGYNLGICQEGSALKDGGKHLIEFPQDEFERRASIQEMLQNRENFYDLFFKENASLAASVLGKLTAIN